MTTATHHALFHAMFDDAALFPPGDAPMSDALPAHRQHHRNPRAPYVGPLVIPAAGLDELARVRSRNGDHDPLDVAVTFADGPRSVRATLDAAGRIRGLRVVAIEVAVPQNVPITEVMSTIDAAVASDVRVFVEIPRRHPIGPAAAALTDSRFFAKLRTGGTRPEAYPDEGELAAVIHRLVAAGVAFKATAGLHHAVRNTDANTGFEQHGFLNILAAVDAATQSASVDDLIAVLANRDGADLAGCFIRQTEDEGAQVRSRFLSLGTCSILEPMADLVQLGLIPASDLYDVSEGKQA